MSQSPSATVRFRQANGLSDLSAAVDEIYALRALLAQHAMVLEDALALSSFPRGRRAAVADLVTQARGAARGHLSTAADLPFAAQSALSSVDAPKTLTNSRWAEQRALVPVDTAGSADA